MGLVFIHFLTTLLPSHWIPATARQVPTYLLQPQPTPSCGLPHTEPQGCDTPTPRRPQAQGHWTQENKPQPAQAKAPRALCCRITMYSRLPVTGKIPKKLQTFSRPYHTLPLQHVFNLIYRARKQFL